MKQNEPGTDSGDDNTVNDILQRCMLQGVEKLKDLSMENSHTEDYCAETDMQGMVQDENLTLSDMQRTGCNGKKGIPENSFSGKKEILSNSLVRKESASGNVFVSKDAPVEKTLPPLRDVYRKRQIVSV